MLFDLVDSERSDELGLWGVHCDYKSHLLHAVLIRSVIIATHLG